MPDGAKVDDDGGPIPDSSTGDTAIPPSGNPIEGIAAPTEVAVLTGVYTEGPVWTGTNLYFSTYAAGGNGGAFVKLTPPNTSDAVHPATAGAFPLGNAVDPKAPSTFVSIEIVPGGPSGALIRTPLAGGAGTPVVLSFDAGGAAFDAPNDLIIRKDGTIYMTDPGYQNPGTVTNHLWRISPTGGVFETVVEGRPNGVALSVDEKTLYVSFTDPPAPSLPQIMKYPVAVDGTLGVATKFSDVGPLLNDLDGIAVDASGNVYAAVKNGVDVFKADGSAKWGHITTTKPINNVAFGGADKKTLYMTSSAGMLQTVVKIAGL